MRYLLVLILGSLCKLTTQDTFLFSVTDGYHPTPPGLYGAAIDDSRGYSRIRTTYDFRYGYHCTESNKRGLELSAVAYDKVSGHVLLVEKNSNKQILTMYEGHVCVDGGCGTHVNSEGCTNGICKWKALRQEETRLRLLFDEFRFSVSDPTPAAFAFHDSEVYFISQYRKGVGLYETRNVIELRKLTGCADPYPVMPNSGFDIEECSEVLATMADEQGLYPSYEPMAGLKVEAIGDQLFAFATLKRLRFSNPNTGDYDTVFVGLYAVPLTPPQVPYRPELLWEEDVGKDYQMYIIGQLGNIDYKDGKICWSAIDRIICADFKENHVHTRHIRYAVERGAAKNVVCLGDDLYSSIITGVAIADATYEYISIYFGCMADIPGVGGTGFVRLHHYEFNTKGVLRPVLNATESPVYSGQLFISHKCRYPDPTSPDPPHIIDRGTGPEPIPGHSTQGATNQRSCYKTVIAMTLTALSYVIFMTSF